MCTSSIMAGKMTESIAVQIVHHRYPEPVKKTRWGVEHMLAPSPKPISQQSQITPGRHGVRYRRHFAPSPISRESGGGIPNSCANKLHYICLFLKYAKQISSCYRYVWIEVHQFVSMQGSGHYQVWPPPPPFARLIQHSEEGLVIKYFWWNWWPTIWGCQFMVGTW